MCFSIILNNSLAFPVSVVGIKVLLRQHSRIAEPVISGSADFGAHPHTVHLDFQSQEVAAWPAVSEAVKTATHCQAFAAFRLVSAERQELECPYPVSYTQFRANETKANFVCRLTLEKKKNTELMKRT